jgi:hypothetical protein
VAPALPRPTSAHGPPCRTRSPRHRRPLRWPARQTSGSSRSSGRRPAAQAWAADRRPAYRARPAWRCSCPRQTASGRAPPPPTARASCRVSRRRRERNAGPRPTLRLCRVPFSALPAGGLAPAAAAREPDRRSRAAPCCPWRLPCCGQRGREDRSRTPDASGRSAAQVARQSLGGCLQLHDVRCRRVARCSGCIWSRANESGATRTKSG